MNAVPQSRWLHPHRLIPLFLAIALALGWAPPLQAAPLQPTVNVGFRLENIHGFSAKEKTYSAEGSLWLTFDAAVREQLQREQLRIIDLIRFYNLIQPWNSRIEPLSQEPIALPNGRYTQGYRFSGLFYSDDINYYGSPFGELPLSFILESKSDSAQGLLRQIQLQVMPGGGEVGSRAGLSGYNLRDWNFYDRDYQRQSRISHGLSTQVDRVIFDITYAADTWAALVKWILPLAIVMLIMLLTPNLSSFLGSDRIAVPPVVLLTLVFMQQAYRETLPTLPYLTFLDGLYAFSSIVTLAFFITFIWGCNLMEKTPEGDRPRIALRIDRRDRQVQWVSLAGYGLLTLLGWWQF